MAFWGEKEQVIDDKNRLTFPSIFRDQIGADAEIVLVRGLDRCIWVYTKNRFEDAQKSLPNVAFRSQELRDLQRIFFGGAHFAAMDKQFRVLIPEHLKEYAGLKKDVVIMGVDDRFEIWDREVWRERLKANIGQYEKYAESIFTEGASVRGKGADS